MHLTHAFILLPFGKVVHCRFGYFLFTLVGLYLPRSLTRVVAFIDFLPQIEQILDMVV
jgi:hypothetical protein